MKTKVIKKAMMLPVVAALFSAGLYSLPAHAGFISNVAFPKGTASGSDNRRYGLYIPSGYVSGTAVPMVVVIHGCRINEHAMMDGTRFEVAAERDKFIVLYPFIGANDTTATNDDGGRNPRCWGFWTPTFENEMHRGAGEVGDIKRMVDKVKTSYTIDNNRVYVTGISSGGAAVTMQMVAYPDVYAAGAPVEGVPYRETTAVYTGTTTCSTVLNNTTSAYARATSATVADMRTEMNKSTLRRVPIMIFHNKKDCTVPFKVGEAIKNAYAQVMNAEGQAINVTTPVATPVSGTTDGLPWTHSKYGAGPDGQSLIETFYYDATAAQVKAVVSTLSTNPYVTTAGNEPTTDVDRGHWWSGGNRGPWSLNKGPSTTEAMWAFFKVHTLNNSGTTTTTAAATTTTAGGTTTTAGGTTTTAGGTTTTAGGTTTTTATTTTTTAGATLTPGSGTWVKETTTYGTPNLPDTYVYVPKNVSPNVLNGKRALMLSLPGCGQSSANIINKGFNWETTAEQYGMVVLASSIPTGGSRSSGCWDWVGAQTRTGRDNVPLMKFVNAVKARANLNIDPNQVYVSGLSSGAAQTHIIGCAFPDVFAAVIPNAGPALGGTSTSIFSAPTITAQQVMDNCKSYNGNNYNAYFNTQLFANVYGSGDTTVLPAHNVRNRDGMKLLYPAATSGGTVTVAGGGTVDLWKDANNKIRIGNQVVQGMAHAWPAGSGGSGGGTYVDYTHVNFPAYIVPWLWANNLRVTATTTTTAAATTTTTAGGTTTTGGATTTTTAAATTTTTTATTTTTTAGACYNTSNYVHVTAGRAHQSLGYALANGSNQNCGLYNTFTTCKLRKTGTNYYIKDATCP